jgi:hypothetical protein
MELLVLRLVVPQRNHYPLLRKFKGRIRYSTQANVRFVREVFLTRPSKERCAGEA